MSDFLYATITQDWELVRNEWKKPIYDNLKHNLKKEYTTYNCYPLDKDIFKAFNLCLFQNLKVVIIGQDPYHGVGEANGLCFSVNDGIKIPPSLRNIFKELKTDLNIIKPTGNLTHWAQQGILLLNSTLTVRENMANSHKSIGWEQFTDTIIQEIVKQKKDIVFILWGSFAQKKIPLIDESRHYILKSSHPSPLGAYKGFLGCKHFSKTNNFLKQKNKIEIDWS